MDISRLDLNLLLALDVLLDELNVTRAAKRLSISQPALSARLARLRDLFGDPLLTPTQRGMVPTARALELRQPLRDALDQVRSVVMDAETFDPQSAEMTFTLAATDYVQYVVIMPLALHLQHTAPGIKIIAGQLEAKQLPRQLERGQVDAAFFLQGMGGAALRQRKLFDENYVVTMRRDHPEASARMSLDTYCGLDHLVISPIEGALKTAVDTQLFALGKSRRVQMSVSNFLFAPELVARSDMALLAPERLVRDRVDTLAFHDPPFPVEGFAISLAWHDRTHNHPAYIWLREQIALVASGRGIHKMDTTTEL